jgi:hypothetical protein
MLRTLELCLGSRIDMHIPVGHPVVAWMLEHVCLILTATVRGSDGITPWTRVRGRAFAQQMVGFGESVLYKYPSKGPKHAPDGNIGALGADGIFLGYSRSSNTFVVATKDGIVTARSITRKPESDRWLPEHLACRAQGTNRTSSSPLRSWSSRAWRHSCRGSPSVAQSPPDQSVRPGGARLRPRLRPVQAHRQVQEA